MKKAMQFSGKVLYGRMLAVVTILSFSVASAEAQPPMVTFPLPAGSAGNQTPLFTPTNENPVDYGLTGFNFGWTYDSFQGFNAGGGNALIRMAPTLQGPGAFQAMSETKQWVFHFEFRVQGAYPGPDAFLFSKHSPPDIGQPSDGREDRMFGIWHTGDPNSWQIRVGDNSGGWNTVASNLQMVNEEYVDFDVHYKPGSGFDFYWEGNLVAANETTGHGRYDLDFWQIEEVPTGSGTITSIRNVRLGEIIPEPGSVVLLTAGLIALGATSRRRKR